jgi:transcriptional regulator with XRE-family HTH domain
MGKHAVNAARLKAINEPLGTPPSYFFEEQDGARPYDDLRITALRLARKLQRIEGGSPEGFQKLWRMITELARDKE